MLAAAAEAYRHAQMQLRFSCIMCLDVAAVRLMEAAAERCRQSSSLFPEHRYSGRLAGCSMQRPQCIAGMAGGLVTGKYCKSWQVTVAAHANEQMFCCAMMHACTCAVIAMADGAVLYCAGCGLL